MLTIQEIQERAYANACAKGWHDKPLYQIIDNEVVFDRIVDHDRVLRMHALMHTELSEARTEIEHARYAAYIGENGKPEGAIIEIADFIIRVCDTTRALDISLDYDLHAHIKRLDHTGFGTTPISTAHMLECVRVQIDHATEYVRVDAWLPAPNDTYGVRHYGHAMTAALEHAVRLAFVIGQGLNLGAALESKMAYNETRPHRHGGKRA